MVTKPDQLSCCIHLNQKKVALFDWRLVFHVRSFITPGAFWGKTIAWQRCVCDGRCGYSSIPTPYSQDLSWRVICLVWNFGLTTEEVAVYPGVFLTLTVECYPRSLSLMARGSTQTK